VAHLAWPCYHSPLEPPQRSGRTRMIVRRR
jgi:hypothetical protein